jgi:hypothetical protein
LSVSSRSLVELVLLGPTNDQRQLQDSPILGDVWIAFAAGPAEPMDRLIATGHLYCRLSSCFWVVAALILEVSDA